MANPVVPNIDGSNPGPAGISTINTQLLTAAQAGSNANFGSGVPQGANALRLIAVARGVSLATTGDVAVMPIINSISWAPATVVFANGQVNGVQGSIATASVGVFTGAASTGSTLKTQAALASNSAAGSSIVAATAIVNLAFTGSYVYLNCGTALAGATVDCFLYAYDES